MNLQLIAQTNKTAIEIMVQDAIKEVIEQGNVLEAAERLAAMESIIKQIRADEKFIDLVVSEAQKNSGRITTASGAKIEVCEVGTSYDYSHDAEWCRLAELADRYAAHRKTREKYLQGIPAGKMVTDSETGEVLGVGPAKSSKTSFKITLAR